MKLNARILLLLLFVPTVSMAQETTSDRKTKPEKYCAISKSDIEKFGFHRFVTKDKYERQIQFYVSKTGSKEKLPLVVCIQGSGSQSVFLEVDTPDGKRIGSGGPEAVVTQQFRDRVRVLVVEKPGVEFLKQPSIPGSAEEASEEYSREFSLDRWVEAINASLIATIAMPDVDSEKVLVLGHSEGGQVACQLAAVNDKVTHVANMAGGGPTQLFDLIQQARSGDMYDPKASPQERVDALLNDWKKVLAEPLATDKFILGHSHLRWSSFLKTSPIEAILKSKAKVFVATGTADTSSLPASSEAFYTELLARGRDCTYERIEGGDHAFMTRNDRNGEGWFEANKKAVNWFLDSQNGNQ